MPPDELVTAKSEDDGVDLLVIRHPPVNALSTAVLAELRLRIDSLSAAGRTRALLLTGDGPYFSAGADVKEMAGLDPAEAPRLVARVGETFRHIAEFPSPVIAAVNGLAVGGGLELALACDLRVAGDSAKLGAPETGLGLLPAYGGTQRLPRAVGLSKALELVVTGSMVSAAEALRIGLVNKVVPAGQELRAARDLAHAIGQKAPRAIRAAKRAIRASAEMPLSEGLRLESELFVTEVLPSRDLAEGLLAFAEHRPPKFRGD